MKVLFFVLVLLIVANMCAVDDGQSRLLVALLIHEKCLLARSASSTGTQPISALGLLKEFDDAYAKEDVARATVACYRFKRLGFMDWQYLTENQQIEHCSKILHAQGLLKRLKSKKNACSISEEELAADEQADQWLIDCINKGLCANDAWKGFRDEIGNQFPESKVLNAKRIAYLEYAGKSQKKSEKD